MNIKFLNFNLWYGFNWKKEIDLIKKLNPDIFTLQEVTKNIPKFGLENTDIFEILKDSFREYSGVYSPQTYKVEGKKEIGHGQVIFSKFPILSTNTHYYFNKANWPSSYEDQSTNLLEIKIKIGEKEISIFTTHFSYSNQFKDNTRKIEEANKTVKIIQKHEPFIFAGDLNSPPQSEVIKIINKNYQYVDLANSPTWTKQPFSYKGFTETELKWKLDYIFYSKEFRPAKYKIINTDISDHLPTFVEFELESNK